MTRPAAPGLPPLVAESGSLATLVFSRSIQEGDPGLCDRTAWPGSQCQRLSLGSVGRLTHAGNGRQVWEQQEIILLALLTRELTRQLTVGVTCTRRLRFNAVAGVHRATSFRHLRSQGRSLLCT